MFDFVLLKDFMDTGGEVLYAILFLNIALWWVLVDRLWFFFKIYPQSRQRQISNWHGIVDKASWYGESKRIQLISQLDCAMSRNLKLANSMIALLPMLGLLGTVTGMIQVFDVLAVTGSSNPRAMADGVSAATIPTMAGMVAALAALPISTRLEQMHKNEMQKLSEEMPSETQEA